MLPFASVCDENSMHSRFYTFIIFRELISETAHTKATTYTETSSNTQGNNQPNPPQYITIRITCPLLIQ